MGVEQYLLLQTEIPVVFLSTIEFSENRFVRPLLVHQFVNQWIESFIGFRSDFTLDLSFTLFHLLKLAIEFSDSVHDGLHCLVQFLIFRFFFQVFGLQF